MNKSRAHVAQIPAGSPSLMTNCLQLKRKTLQDGPNETLLAGAPAAVSASHLDLSRVPVNPNRSAHPLPFLDTIQRSFGRHDVSGIRAHTGGVAAAQAQALGADAFARGSDVTFSRTPTLHTAAHEAAHVVQQRAGVDVAGGVGQAGDAYERHADAVADRVASGQSSEALLDAPPAAGWSRSDAIWMTSEVVASPPPVVQMRRIPPNVRTLLISAGADGANFTANADGAQRLLARAMAELTAADQTKVLTSRRGALTEAQFNALPLRERLSKHAEAIVALFPSQELGDPKLIDTGPRPATPDAANLAKVVTKANGIFADIATGTRDAWLTDVFGAGSIATAKAKYAKGRTAMNRLHGSNGIVTDRSGYSEEVSLGGLTDPPSAPLDPKQKIRVALSVIDDPTNNESITTLLHESLHAGNADVRDKYDGFQTETEANKLTFSSCFEVVPWRILEPTNAKAFTGQKFIPAGTTVGGVTAPPKTNAEKGATAASELFREAWTTGLNLHTFYVGLHVTPTNWTVPPPGFGGRRFDNSLPFWSKVEQLTIHSKTSIDPASPDKAKHPVSQIDVALSEGLQRKLANGMFMLGPLQKDADIVAFENANSTAPERAAAFPGGTRTITTQRDFLLKLTTRHPTVGPLTGALARDLRVVEKLGTLNWATVLDARTPASFP